MFHDKHYVSAKLALFSSDLQSVLVMRYPQRNISGLPGGHVDRNETPDEAIARELMEELSVTVENMKRVDFFYSNRIILAYTAIAPRGIIITPTDPSYEFAEWVTRDELETTNMATEYIRFILQNWPKP